MTRQRGGLIDWDGERTVTATVHPSSIVRARGAEGSDDQAHAQARAAFAADLTAVAALLDG